MQLTQDLANKKTKKPQRTKILLWFLFYSYFELTIFVLI